MSDAAGLPRPEAARPRHQTAGAMPVRTLFFGSGPFGIPILEAALHAPDIRVVGVVSVPDRPAGRGGRLASPPVAERARTLGLPVLQPVSLRDLAAVAAIAALEPELALLADYGRLVPEPVLAIPSRGFLNVHPSLLPRHRGATPIQATILAGDPEAGVSLFEMDAGLDAGPLVAASRWPLRGDESAQELELEAGRRGAALLAEVLPAWLAGSLPAHAQAADGVTTTRPLRREDGRLRPDRPADELARLVRAFQPWPGAFVDTVAGRLAVVDAEARPPGDEARPPGDLSLPRAVESLGTLVADGDGLALTTSHGVLRLRTVRPAGGRTMTGAELRRGRPGLVGSRVS